MNLQLAKIAGIFFTCILLMSCFSSKRLGDIYVIYHSDIIESDFDYSLTWVCANGWGIATRDKNWILSISFVSEDGGYRNLDYKTVLPSENHFVIIHDLRMVGDKDRVIAEEAGFDRFIYEGGPERTYSAVAGVVQIRANHDATDVQAILSRAKFVTDSGESIYIEKAKLKGNFLDCGKVGQKKGS